MSVSIKDIAFRVGVTDATVSMALKNNPRISSTRREQIQKAAKEMGYRPHLLARGLRIQKTHTVGILAGSLQTSITNMKVGAIEKFMVEQGYQVLLGLTRTESDRLVAYIHSMQDRQVDGLIILDPTLIADLQQVTNLLDVNSTPCVLADSMYGEKGLPGVHVDRAAGMEQLARYLAEIGHRDMLFIGTGRGNDLVKWKGVLRGIGEEVLKKRIRLRGASTYHPGWCEPGQYDQLPPPPFRPNSYSIFEEEERAYHKGQEVAGWSDRPTVVINASDCQAMAFINGLESSGLSVPSDLSVAGFDDTDEARFFKPRLTTVHQPREELAEKAARMLLSLMQKNELAEKHVWLKPKLVVRDSVRPPG